MTKLKRRASLQFGNRPMVRWQRQFDLDNMLFFSLLSNCLLAFSQFLAHTQLVMQDCPPRHHSILQFFPKALLVLPKLF